MGRPMDDYDEIAIAEVVVYSVYLVGGIFLCLKHGFGKSAGWRFLIILALARLIGSAMRLASITWPNNENLYIGWMTLNGIGVGPLIMMLLGLLGRVFESTSRSGRVLITPLHQRILGLIMLVAVILLIVGGTNAQYSLAGGTPKITYPVESKVAVALMVVVLAALILASILAIFNRQHIAPGEGRLLIAIICSIPFVAVRLAYSCYLILGEHTSTVWIYLACGVIMEMIVVLFVEVVGFTLDKAPEPIPTQEPEPSQMEMGQMPGKPQQQYQSHSHKRRRRGGPIQMLVGFLADKMSK